MPKETDQQKAKRRDAMQEGLKKATLVPFHTMELVDRAWDPMLELARIGQYSSRSDLEVGAKALEACLYGAHRNVLINAGDIKDEAFRKEMAERAGVLMRRGETKMTEIQAAVAGRTGDVV